MIGITFRQKVEEQKGRVQKIGWQSDKRTDLKGQETGNKKETVRRVGAEETLEKTACKYANTVPLKWR